MMKVLVYGWYHQGNIGDDLFIEAFQHLFPSCDFTFTDRITTENLTDVDAVFFGGGSFLSGRPHIDDMITLISKKIFYLGIGIEDNIHPDHMDLMNRACLVATRSPKQVDKLRLFCKNVIAIPDLVYSLQDKVKSSNKLARSVLIMTNLSVVPDRSDPNWKHASWNYFKSEFAQFIDWLVENQYHPTLFSMCQGSELDDQWASSEIINFLENRNIKYLQHPSVKGIEQVTEFVSKYNIVITQRFHGIVLAEMTRTPYMAIHHHDKLKLAQPGEGSFLSYYNCSKQVLIDSFERTMKMNFTHSLPIESTIYETFVKEVLSLI